MGDKIEKPIRRGAKAWTTGFTSEAGVLDKPFRKGTTAAKRDASKQLALQQKRETTKLLEAESEVQEKRALARSGKAGRQSLIKSSGGGLSTNLGGTA